jgi:tRNA pseudouridine38-40 synthase
VKYHYKLTLQYKGSHYLGWQVQPEAAGLTIQGELNKALEKVSKSTDVRTMGAGRTDAGVHALGQIAKVSIPIEIQPDNFQKAINVHLPSDIRIIESSFCNENFHPTVDAKRKLYHYRFTNKRMFTAFQNDLIYNHPFELDFEVMNKACQLLIGEHDFSNFYCEGTEVSSNVRTIYDCGIMFIEQGEWEMLPSHAVFYIEGNGFLKQMVRLLMGALWNVGRSKITLDQFQSALSAQKVARLGPVAPPEGLYMVRVKY